VLFVFTRNEETRYTTVLIDFKDISLAHYCINKSMTKAEFSFYLKGYETKHERGRS
jgi:hypothetical protein